MCGHPALSTSFCGSRSKWPLLMMVSDRPWFVIAPGFCFDTNCIHLSTWSVTDDWLTGFLNFLSTINATQNVRLPILFRLAISFLQLQSYSYYILQFHLDVSRSKGIKHFPLLKMLPLDLFNPNFFFWLLTTNLPGNIPFHSLSCKFNFDILYPKLLNWLEKYEIVWGSLYLYLSNATFMS